MVTHVYYATPGRQDHDFGFVSAYLFPHLPLGLTTFFALSAFLLYRPIAAAVLRGRRRPDTRRYLVNRALRILPAYWVVFLVAALLIGAAQVRTSPSTMQIGYMLDPVALLANLTLTQNYSPATAITGMGAVWSLAIEAVFYLCLPLLGLMAAALAAGCAERRSRRLAALAPALLLLAIGLSGKVAAALVAPTATPVGLAGDWHSVIERSFWAHADLLAFGMAVAVLRVEHEDGLLRLPAWWRKATALGALTIGVLAAVAFADEVTWVEETPLQSNVSNYAYDTAMAMAIGLVLALVVISGPGARGRRLVSFLESPPIVVTGVVSYSLFLWHGPILLWVADHALMGTGRLGFLVNLAVVGGVSWLLALVTYRWVEQPAMRLRARRRRPAAATEPISPEQAQAAP